MKNSNPCFDGGPIDPPEDRPRNLHEDEYGPGLCWECFWENDELSPLRLTHIGESSYLASGDGLGDDEWRLTCEVTDDWERARHNPGVHVDPISTCEHAHAILVDYAKNNPGMHPAARLEVAAHIEQMRLDLKFEREYRTNPPVRVNS